MQEDEMKLYSKLWRTLTICMVLVICLIATGYFTDFKYSYAGYKIHAEKKIYSKAVENNIGTAALSDERPIEPPSDLSVKSLNYEEIILSWQETLDAESYDIYRSENNQDNYALIATIMKPDFKDIRLSPGSTYYYKVSAVRGGRESGRSKEATVTLTAVNQKGNSKGNITSQAFFAKESDWIYFSNNADKNTLYKTRTDGSQLIQISDLKCGYINVLNGWVYFTNSIYSGGKMYRIRTDGTSLTKLTDDNVTYINVIGQWIYYSNSESRLYKMKIDGSGKVKLNNDATSDVIVDGDWIYYTGLFGEIKKIKNDGTGQQKLSGDLAEYINVENDWIYYCSVYENNKIYKIRSDGSGKTKVCNDSIGLGMIVEDGWIYYMNVSDNRRIYKIKTDGTGKACVSVDPGNNSINKIDGYIYYSKMVAPYKQDRVEIELETY